MTRSNRPPIETIFHTSPAEAVKGTFAPVQASIENRNWNKMPPAELQACAQDLHRALFSMVRDALKVGRKKPQIFVHGPMRVDGNLHRMLEGLVSEGAITGVSSNPGASARSIVDNPDAIHLFACEHGSPATYLDELSSLVDNLPPLQGALLFAPTAPKGSVRKSKPSLAADATLLSEHLAPGSRVVYAGFENVPQGAVVLIPGFGTARNFILNRRLADKASRLSGSVASPGMVPVIDHSEISAPHSRLIRQLVYAGPKEKVPNRLMVFSLKTVPSEGTSA